MFKKKIEEYPAKLYTPEYRHKDVTKYMMRPLHEFTRREILAIKDLLQSPEEYEELKEKHPVMKEDEEFFKKLEPEYEKFEKERKDYYQSKFDK